jgi:hypothetical protein
MKWIFFFLLIPAFACAQSERIKELYKNKDFDELADIYLNDILTPRPREDLILISSALRRTGHFREDIIVNLKILSKYYTDANRRLLTDVKHSNSVDPDEYPIGQKVLYWFILNDYANLIKKYSSKSDKLDKDQRRFQIISKLLSHLEFRESKVDKLTNIVNSHLQYLNDKIYHSSSSLYIQYVSWQREVNLNGSDGSTLGLNVTNRGYCAGGDIGTENYRWHFYLDGCFLYGSGGVKSKQDTSGGGTSYQQSNVRAFGFKGGPGVSMIVSSSKSRIGIKLPVIYTIQRFNNPPNNAFTISETNPLSYMATLYSRFQFNKWYLQTEFGQYLRQQDIFWGLGIGHTF